MKLNKIPTYLDMAAGLMAWLIQFICIAGALVATIATIIHLFSDPMQSIHTAVAVIVLIGIAWLTDTTTNR